MDDRGHLATEQRNPRSMNLHALSIREAFDLINGEDASVAAAVSAARDDICRAIELTVERLQSGGRLIYVGAGTSGRLGVLDATECPPTFLTEPSTVQGVIAGGIQALTQSVEGAEDDQAAGAAVADERGVGPRDVLFAVATGGTTPFVHGALRRAKERGAATVFLACVLEDDVPDDADVSIRVITGPEVLTGSTRMKAGTATKMVLNLLTTITMVRLGKVYENLMVDVNVASNAKLKDRAVRIIQTLTGRPRDEAESLLESSGGRAKTALVMHSRCVGRADAERILAEHGGNVGTILQRVIE